MADDLHGVRLDAAPMCRSITDDFGGEKSTVGSSLTNNSGREGPVMEEPRCWSERINRSMRRPVPMVGCDGHLVVSPCCWRRAGGTMIFIAWISISRETHHIGDRLRQFNVCASITAS